MEKLTRQQAIEQGYTHFGYDGREWQHANSIEDITDEHFNNEIGILLLFDKQKQYTAITAEDIKDMVSDKVEDLRSDETCDDTQVCYESVKSMPIQHFQELANAVNKAIEDNYYYNLTKIELIP